jgi:prepilin-type N-terminal cleavage/methylation domain-containing protein/prepilin-type processing-associated H-X9-DG protein
MWQFTDMGIPTKCRGSAFTLVEMLAVIAILGILVVLLVPSVKGGIDRAKTSACIGNLRQIGSGMLLFAADHNNRYPPYDVDPAEFPDYGNYPKWYNVLQPYLQNTAENQLEKHKVWLCPADSRKTGILTSYGININASPTTDPNDPDYYMRLKPLTSVSGPPSKVIYCADTGQYAYTSRLTYWTYNPANPAYAMEYRHQGRSRDETKPYSSGSEIANQKGYANCCFFDGHVESLRADQLQESMFLGK